MRYAIIFDTEFTTWPGAMASGWAEPWQHREIVQIAGAKVDPENLHIVEEFDCLVQPRINPQLSDFFTELTGITQDDVTRSGVDFPTAFKKFKDFIGEGSAYCYGWDGKVINENAVLANHLEWCDTLEIHSLHPYFQEHGVDTQKINSGRLAQYFGIDIDIREHNAMDDVYSIHAAICHLNKNGKLLPF